jgi:hypothetical protein
MLLKRREISVGRDLGEMLNSEWLRTRNRPIGSSVHRFIGRLPVVRGQLSVASDPRMRRSETTDDGQRTKDSPKMTR